MSQSSPTVSGTHTNPLVGEPIVTQLNSSSTLRNQITIILRNHLKINKLLSSHKLNKSS